MPPHHPLPDPAVIRNALMVLLNVAKPQFKQEARDAVQCIVREISKLEH